MARDRGVGTIQSIEHALRALDKNLADETERQARAEKMLADYREQLGRPFEHGARLKELVAKQAELNAALDLDKGEQQAAAPAEGDAEPGADGLGDQQSAPEPVPRPAYKPRRRREYPSVDVDDADPEEEDVAPQRSPPTMGQLR